MRRKKTTLAAATILALLLGLTFLVWSPASAFPRVIKNNPLKKSEKAIASTQTAEKTTETATAPTPTPPPAPPQVDKTPILPSAPQGPAPGALPPGMLEGVKKSEEEASKPTPTPTSAPAPAPGLTPAKPKRAPFRYEKSGRADPMRLPWTFLRMEAEKKLAEAAAEIKAAQSTQVIGRAGLAARNDAVDRADRAFKRVQAIDDQMKAKGYRVSQMGKFISQADAGQTTLGDIRRTLAMENDKLNVAEGGDSALPPALDERVREKTEKGGILWLDTTPYCMVDGYVLKAGDRVPGASQPTTVLRINKRQVIYQVKDQEFSVDLLVDDLSAADIPMIKALQEKALQEKALQEKVSTEKVPTEPVPTEKAPTEPFPTEPFPTEKPPAEKPPAEKSPAEKSPADTKEGV